MWSSPNLLHVLPLSADWAVVQTSGLAHHMSFLVTTDLKDCVPDFVSRYVFLAHFSLGDGDSELIF